MRKQTKIVIVDRDQSWLISNITNWSIMIGYH